MEDIRNTHFFTLGNYNHGNTERDKNISSDEEEMWYMR